MSPSPVPPPEATPRMSPPYLGTARVPVPGRSGSQRRRMAVARPPLQGCVTSLDLARGDTAGGGVSVAGGGHTDSPPVPSRSPPSPVEEDDVGQVGVSGGEVFGG